MPDVPQPRALIVTVYGLYARHAAGLYALHAAGLYARHAAGLYARDAAGLYARDAGGRPAGGWLPISLLVRLLAELDVDEPAVRSAISRLKRRGLLVASRRDGAAGYALSVEADAILDEGDARIFGPTEPSLSDGWLLAVFSVPETERAKRHTLRSRLGALGFGAAAPGVWVAPAHRYDLTAASLERHGLANYVDLFRAEYLAFGEIDKLAGQWWDLDALRAEYEAFIEAYRPALDGQTAPRRAFADWVRVLTAWRGFPYHDPGLPVELLPAGWPAPEARQLFDALRARLSAPASDFVALLR